MSELTFIHLYHLQPAIIRFQHWFIFKRLIQKAKFNIYDIRGEIVNNHVLRRNENYIPRCQPFSKLY